MTSRERRIAVLSTCAVCILIVLGGAAAASLGLYNVGADAPHSALAERLLGYIRTHSIAVRASMIDVPSLKQTDMIEAGASHYNEMCTGCHLAPGMLENEMRPGLNPKPPILASGPPGNPAIQFWIVKHGIEMTGMPAWGTTHTDEEIWDIVAFLQVLPKLSHAQYHDLVARAESRHPHDTPMLQNMKM